MEPGSLFTGDQWQNQRQKPPTEIQGVHAEHQQTLFYCGHNQASTQAVQWVNGAFHLEGIYISGHGPGQTAVGGLAWLGRGWG